MSNVVELYTSHNNLNTLQINTRNYVSYEGTLFELNIKANFKPSEFNTLKTKYFRNAWLTYSLEYFNTDADTLDKTELNYARLLATFRRINLDFYKLNNAPLTLSSYPMIDEMDNFKIFDSLFEKYYTKFDPHNENNKKLRGDFYKRAKMLTLKLWMSGYGLLPGLTEKCIDDSLIDKLLNFMQENNIRNLGKFLRYISFVLSREDDSPVTKQCILRESTEVFEREMKKWDKIKTKENSILWSSFRNFLLNHYYKRTSGILLYEYKDSNREIKRVTYPEIKISTFVNYSIGLRNMLSELESMNISTIEDALNHGILEVLAETRDEFEKTKYSTMKIAIKQFVDLYIKDNNLNLNIERIVPTEISRRDTTYGQILNVSDVVSLIDILSDDTSSFYDDISLADFRCRYVCLLQLSTGQRLSEILCLSYDCIKTNKNNESFLDIHKTKVGNGNVVPATTDVIRYVESLRKVAPEDELLFSTDFYPYLDNLKMKRLIANKFNDGPLSKEAVNNFLKRIQKHLWGEDLSHKDKVFTSHDFRRMKATYMNWCGYDSEAISKQLGQSNINSQLPYLQTKPIEHQEIFANIYEKGLYSDLYQENENGDILINQVAVINKAGEIASVDSYDSLIKSILSSINDANEISIPNVDITALEPTGFPIGIFSCSASNMIHCTKSKITCFSCIYYNPDEDSLDNHKTELFRYLILSQNQSKTLKITKDIVLKRMMTEKITFINESIEKSFNKLFSKFNLNEKEIVKIKNELEKKSKSYLRKYGKINPSPTFKDALKYLQEGKI